jgi:hypothetical protein
VESDKDDLLRAAQQPACSYCVLALVEFLLSRVEVVLKENNTNGSGEAKDTEYQIPIFEIKPIPADVDVATGENESCASDLVNPEPPRKLATQRGLEKISHPEKDKTE